MNADYWTALGLGVVGSLHCAGMCGPLALALPRAGNTAASFTAGRIAYNFGRIVTYVVMGLVFGLFGKAMLLAGIQRGVSIALGVALLVGLFAPRKLALWRPVTFLVNQLKSRMAGVLRRRSVESSCVLGLLNGLLPCGLVYVAGAGATATGHVLSGATYMAAFGAGTVPMMLGIGLSGHFVPISWRLRMARALPVSVVLLATLLILRGMPWNIPYFSVDLASGTCCHR